MYALEDRHWWFRGRRAVIWALLRRAAVPESGRLRVLDAGCGTGRNLHEYDRLGAASGVDASAEAVDFCRRRGLTAVVRSGVESLPFESDAFDVAFATDVLEHVEDDHAALAELRRVVAPGGTLVSTVPAFEWLWSDSDVALGHHRRYTRRRLLDVVGSSGWRASAATYFNSLLLPPIAVTRALRRPDHRRPELEQTPAALNRLLAAPMQLEAALIGRGVRLPAGVSLGVVCRRD
ncbi:MAG: class I SAM-dependent methyltransferase [Actinomycetota bacterium]|nr:class I SAM-dependent methyltransferase [Actinomycetota bacterium]